MKVMLIVKADSELEATDAATNMLNNPLVFKDETPLPRLGAYRLDVEIENTLPLYKWFNMGHDVPFPTGTLLWFQVTP